MDEINEDAYFEAKVRKHQQEVARCMLIFARKLIERATTHDASKLKSPEREIYMKYAPKLRDTTYGSDEYKQYLNEMKVALSHHYAANKHHPEHYYNHVKKGDSAICLMSLVDIVEMICDWYAAGQQHADGNFNHSIDINEEQYNIHKQLSQVFRNTAEMFDCPRPPMVRDGEIIVRGKRKEQQAFDDH